MRAWVAVFVGVIAGTSRVATAHPLELGDDDATRTGLQIEGVLGASVCLASVSPCSAQAPLTGRTGPSFGAGVTLGYRPLRSLLVGVAYDGGLFHADYRDAEGARVYRVAYQHGVFAVLRAIVPLWRFDVGIEVAPGWSRQVFNVRDGFDAGATRELAQGFAFKVAPTLDLYVTRRMFVGAKVDFVVNTHRRACDVSGDGQRSCAAIVAGQERVGVHQIVAGVHLGVTLDVSRRRGATTRPTPSTPARSATARSARSW